MPQALTATISSVDDSVRPYQGPNGPVNYIQGAFADGSLFSVGSKPDFTDRRKADLKALIGREGAYEVEPKQEYQGKKQWKLVSWPGKPGSTGSGGVGPASAGGGRGGSFIPRHRDTPEGAAEERESIHRSVALQQAVILSGVGAAGHAVLHVAEEFYKWLVGQPSGRTFGEQASQQTEAAPRPPQAASPPATDKLTCPACGKTEFAFASRDADGGYFCWKKKGGCGHQWKDGEVLLPGLGGKSVLEEEWEAIEEASKVTELLTCAERCMSQRKALVLEGSELVKLDKKACERAVALSRGFDELFVCEGFLRHMIGEGRLDPGWGEGMLARVAGLRAQFDTRQQSEDRF